MITYKRLSASKGGTAGRGAEALLHYLQAMKSQPRENAQVLDEYYRVEDQRWILTGEQREHALVQDGASIKTEDFLGIARGIAPTGEVIAIQREKRSPGTDLTFGVSKGVSAFWAASDAVTRAIIEAELHEATRSVLKFGLRQGWFAVRRGAGRHQMHLHEAAAHIMSASFIHKTSREGDPQLHQHTVIMNIARTQDGQWRALDFSAVFENQKILSARFDAELARRLKQRLGLNFDKNGANNIDVAGIPAALITQMSKRDAQIRDEMGEHDHPTHTVHDYAWAVTRQDKDRIDSPEQLEIRWRQELLEHIPLEQIYAEAKSYSPQIDRDKLAQAIRAHQLRQTFAPIRDQVRELADEREARQLAQAELDRQNQERRDRFEIVQAPEPAPSSRAHEPEITDLERKSRLERISAGIKSLRLRLALTRSDVLTRLKDALAPSKALTMGEKESAAPVTTREAAPPMDQRSALARSIGAHQVRAALDPRPKAERPFAKVAAAVEESRSRREQAAKETPSIEALALSEWLRRRSIAARAARSQQADRPQTAVDLTVRDEVAQQREIAREAAQIVGLKASAADQIIAEALVAGMRHATAIEDRTLQQQSYLLAAQRGVAPDVIEAAYVQFLGRADILHGEVAAEGSSIKEGRRAVTTRRAAEEEATIRRAAKNGVGRVKDLSALVDKQPEAARLSEEQRNAARRAISGDQISAVKGRAGVGKTTTALTMIGAAEAGGYEPILLAPEHQMAAVLSQDTGRPAKTVASYLRSKTAIQATSRQSLILVDEAGKLSRADMARLMSIAEQTGARVILQGDPDQMQSPGGGAPLQIVEAEIEFAKIETIRRQHTPWMAEATAQMAAKHADKGMAEYLNRDRVHYAEDRTAAIAAAADTYVHFRAQGTVLAMARTRNEVSELNAAIRERLVESSQLGDLLGIEQARQTMSGGKDAIYEIELRVGDRIKLGEKVDNEGILSGDLATVVGRDRQGRYQLALNRHGKDATPIAVAWKDLSTENWTEVPAAPVGRGRGRGRPKKERKTDEHQIAAPRVTHAYASTIHASQGQTVDRAIIVDTAGGLDGRETYVAASRHRTDLAVIVDESRVEKEIRARDLRQAEDNDFDPHREITQEEIQKEWLTGLARFSRNINASDIVAANAAEQERTHDRQARESLDAQRRGRSVPDEIADRSLDRDGRHIRDDLESGPSPAPSEPGERAVVAAQPAAGGVDGPAQTDRGPDADPRRADVRDAGPGGRDRQQDRGADDLAGEGGRRRLGRGDLGSPQRSEGDHDQDRPVDQPEPSDHGSPRDRRATGGIRWTTPAGPVSPTPKAPIATPAPMPIAKAPEPVRVPEPAPKPEAPKVEPVEAPKPAPARRRDGPVLGL